MRAGWIAVLALVLAACGEDKPEATAERAADTVRIATYNTHLARGAAGKLIAELEQGSAQVDAVIRVISAANPDILVINELDYDEERAALDLFQQRLADAGMEYGYRFVAPVNTGKPTGLDLTGDGKDYGPANAQGWGVFEGQFGMAVLSRLPVQGDDVRTFAGVRWSEMPDNLYPLDYYPEPALEVLRLSSKSHWDIPVRAADKTIHLLVSHPTPPVFDGDEDRNGRRNHDEIRFWTDYIDGKDWMLSDQGTEGGLPAGAAFVVTGDLNSDPQNGDGRREAITGLLDHRRVQDTQPKGASGLATSDFPEVGQLRVDYVLPSINLAVAGSGVLWPDEDDPLAATVQSASDHRLVWVDLTIPGLER